MPSRNFSPMDMDSGRSKRKGSKKKGSSSRSRDYDPFSCCTKSIVFFTLEWVIFVLALCACAMAVFNNLIVLREGANDIEATGSQHIYTLWDLSCYGFWGYRMNCFKPSATWEEYHCDKRKDMVLVGGIFLLIGAILVLLINIFMICGKCNCCKFPRLTVFISIGAVVAFLISWAVLLGLFVSNTCTSVIADYPEYPLKNYTKLGPGYWVIIAVFILQIVLLCLLFAWKPKLWIS